MRSPWRADAGREPALLRAGTEHEFTLEAFEVLTLTADVR